MNDIGGIPQYPWDEGDTVFASALNAAIANAGSSSGDAVANVLGYGADPTGVNDSTTAFRNALATGHNVWAPRGTYLITGQLIVAGASQKLYGDGLGTVLLVNASFDPTITTGVILLNGAMRPAVSDLTVQFTQPPDLVKATTASSAAGTNTITVNSNTGIVVGMSVVDRTQRPNAIASPIYNTAQNATTVTNIAGNVITLSANVTAPGVVSGDSIQFAAVRSMFKTLAAGGTATAGGTGIQYPWAIYAASPGNMSRIDKVMVTGAWNGIYLRQSTFQLGKIDMFAYNVGLDIDQCYNFCAISNYVFYVFGQSVTGGPQDALANVAYDGQAVAANLGECDGVGIHNFQTFIGKLNFTASWTWGSFTNLMLDFNASLTVSVTGGGYIQIANIYSTVGAYAHSLPFHMAPSSAGFRVWIDNLYMTNSSGYPSVQVDNGSLAIDNGYMWDGSGAGQPMFQVNNGALYLSDMQLDGGGVAAGMSYIALAGTAVLSIDNCAFVVPANAGCNAVSAGGTAKANIGNITWNGWGLSVPAVNLALRNVDVATNDVTSMQSGSISFNVFTATAHNNTAYGSTALSIVQDGATNNAAFGQGAGNGVTSGKYNTFLGADSGFSAGTNNLTGNNNTAIGYGAGYALSTGVNNTIIGVLAAQTLTTGSGNIFIGDGSAGLAAGTASESNTLRIGTSSGTVLRATAMNTAAPHLFLDWLPASTTYANDAAASAGGVAVGQLYRNGSVVQVRVS